MQYGAMAQSNYNNRDENPASYFNTVGAYQKQVGPQMGSEIDREKFFESLGLPGNLSQQSVLNHGQHQQMQSQQDNYYARQDTMSHIQPSSNEQSKYQSQFKSNFGQRQHQSNQQLFDNGQNNQQMMSPGTQMDQLGNQQLKYNEASDMLADSALSAITPTQNDQGTPCQPPQFYDHSMSAIGSGGMSQGRGNSAQHQQHNQQHQQQVYQTAQFSQGFSKLVSDPSVGQLQQMQQNREQKKDILTITIEIGNGQNENIVIREGDTPEQLAQEFAQRHGISSQLTDLLADQIRMNIEQLSQQQEDTQPRNSLSGVVYDAQQDEVISLASQPSHNKSTVPESEHNNNHFVHNKEMQMQLDQGYAGGLGSTGLQSQESQYQQYPVNHRQNFEPMLMNQLEGIEQQEINLNQRQQQTFSDQNSFYQAQTLFSNPPSNRPSAGQPNSHNGYLDPNSQAYLDWYRGVNQKLQGGARKAYQPTNELKQKPTINPQSQKIIEQKRYGSSNESNSFQNGAPSGARNVQQASTVHQRLHQAALAKQRARKSSEQMSESAQYNPDLGQQYGSSMLPNPGFRQSSYGSGQMRRSSSNVMPSGQLKMMQEREQVENRFLAHKAGARMRSSSVQGMEPATLHRNAPLGQYNSSDKRDAVSQGSKGDSTNYGEQLYRRGMKRKAELSSQIQRARSEQDQREFDKHSFKPIINEVSKNMRRVNNEKPEDFLIKYGKAVKEKINSQRIQKHRQETDNHSFKPQVSKVSEKIVQQKQALSSQMSNKYAKFDSLYQDAQRRQERQEFIYSACIESECTFQPDTEKTKFFNSKSSSIGSRKGQSQVFERLASSQDRSRICIENSQSLSNDLCDPETGQAFFQPKVGRGPRGRSRSKEPGEQLYRDALRARERKEILLRQKEIEIKQKTQRQYSRNRTTQLVEKQKHENFLKIFDRLDSDGDGQISAYRIDISSLEPKLLQVLSPLFVEMEELGMSLDQEEFLDAARRLYDSVTLPERGILIQKHQRQRSNSARAQLKAQQESQKSKTLFKPQLNPNSLKMAEKRRHYEGAGANVATRLNDKKREYDLRMMQKRYQKDNNELMGCTFHPKILGSPIMTQGSFSNHSNSLLGTINYNNFNKGSYDSQMQNNQMYNLPTNSCEPPDLDMNTLANQVVRQMFSGQQQLTPQNQYPNEYGQEPIRSGNGVGHPPQVQLNLQGSPSNSYLLPLQSPAAIINNSFNQQVLRPPTYPQKPPSNPLTPYSGANVQTYTQASGQTVTTTDNQENSNSLNQQSFIIRQQPNNLGIALSNENSTIKSRELERREQY